MDLMLRNCLWGASDLYVGCCGGGGGEAGFEKRKLIM